MKHYVREFILKKTLAKIKFNRIGIYLIISVILLGSLFCVFHKTVYAKSSENFFDYAREEKRREITRTNVEEKQYKTTAQQRNLLFGQIASVILALLWAPAIYFTRKLVTVPHIVKIEFKPNDDLIILPVEATAILSLGGYTRYDMIATLFDLIRRDILYVTNEKGEYRVYNNEGKISDKGACLENFEDFFIYWFIKKIGKNEYFSISRLWEYLSLNSRAMEFDIDYDIWLDEINEFAVEKLIFDDKTENWKSYAAISCVTISVLALVLLYLTYSLMPILLLVVAFLTYTFSNKVNRRSKQAEEKYQRLLNFRDWIEESAKSEADYENKEKWDKIFVYSIPLEKTEIVLSKYKIYETFYYELEEQIEKAIIFVNGIAESSTRQ